MCMIFVLCGPAKGFKSYALFSQFLCIQIPYFLFQSRDRRFTQHNQWYLQLIKESVEFGPPAMFLRKGQSSVYRLFVGKEFCLQVVCQKGVLFIGCLLERDRVLFIGVSLYFCLQTLDGGVWYGTSQTSDIQSTDATRPFLLHKRLVHCKFYHTT